MGKSAFQSTRNRVTTRFVAIPNFNQEGYLPPGIHDCSWGELADRFCNFQSTDRRPRLCRQLQQMMEVLRSEDIASAVIINGSFVTMAALPNDIDLILVLPIDWNFQAELTPSTYNLLSRKRVRKLWGFDILVACENTPEYEAYLEFFQRVRHQEHQRKGVLRISL